MAKSRWRSIAVALGVPRREIRRFSSDLKSNNGRILLAALWLALSDRWGKANV